MKKTLLVSLLLLSLSPLAGIAQDYKTTPNGVRYVIVKGTPGAPAIGLGQMVSFNFKVYNYLDSLLMRPTDVDAPSEAAKSTGDIAEILQYLHKGDSAVAWISTDSLVKVYGQLPPYMPANTWLKYCFSIKNVMSKAEFEAQAKQRAAQMRQEQIKQLKEYATKRKLTVQTTASGLMYAIVKAGDMNAKPAVGKTVSVNYTGKLLNGTIFDTSNEADARASGTYAEGRSYKPIEFALGRGQVIKGWDEGIALLGVGTKAVLLIPSDLAYGERSPSPAIPANAPLIFEVELVSFR